MQVAGALETGPLNSRNRGEASRCYGYWYQLSATDGGFPCMQEPTQRLCRTFRWLRSTFRALSKRLRMVLRAAWPLCRWLRICTLA